MLPYLAEIGVELHHTVAELLHVLSQELVSISDAVVQIAHLVVRVASKKDDTGSSKLVRCLSIPLKQVHAASPALCYSMCSMG